MEPEPADSPLVHLYLFTFGEVVRLVTSDQDVPDSVWETMRTAWADMSVAEREHVEQRTRRAP